MIGAEMRYGALSAKVHALYGENPPQLIVDRLNVERL